MGLIRSLWAGKGVETLLAELSAPFSRVIQLLLPDTQCEKQLFISHSLNTHGWSVFFSESSGVESFTWCSLGCDVWEDSSDIISFVRCFASLCKASSSDGLSRFEERDVKGFTFGA